MFRILALCIVVLVSTIGSDGAIADDLQEKLKTVRAAALEIRKVIEEEGYRGGLALVDDCYGKILRPSIVFNKEVEACLTKDFLVAALIAGSQNQLTAEQRLAKNIDPNRTFDEMRRRLGATYIFFGVPTDQATAFGKLLTENALKATIEKP